MKIHLKNLNLILAVFGFVRLEAQVPRKTVVEHFTNTNCSICASRNPGFYTNLQAQSNVLHLAIHPSAPYSNCVLSLQNPSENDARTNFYGVYGSTPRLVIQGNVISPNQNYADPTLFNPFNNAVSPISIKVRLTEKGNDSLKVSIVLKTEATHSLTSQLLFVALVEDTIFYTGTNGETRHIDVFRRSVTGASGMTAPVANPVGDSTRFEFTSVISSTWNKQRIYALAVLQNANNKEINQAERSEKNLIVTGIPSTKVAAKTDFVKVFQQDDRLIFETKNFTSSHAVIIYDSKGKIVGAKEIDSAITTFEISNLERGLYLLRFSNPYGSFYAKKIVIQ